MTTEIERRRRTRARLKRVQGKLRELEVRLEALHADRSGAAAMLYRPPLIPDECYHLGLSLARIGREAAAGCDLSSKWMQETEEQRARIDHLRATPLQKRAPDYDGPHLMPMHVQHMGKPSRRRYYVQRPPEELAAEHCARIAARKVRGRALLEEYLSGEDFGAAHLPPERRE